MKKLSESDTLVPAIAEKLRRQIWFGQLAPSEHLNQKELAAGLRVSIIPLREAMRILQVEGLVEMVPYRGVRVAPVTTAEVEEWLLEMRCFVDVLLPIAVPLISETALERLRVLARLLDSPYSKVEYNLEQWSLILAPLGMPRLNKLVEQVTWRYGRFRNSPTWESLEAHWDVRPNRDDILEAFAAKDGARAAKAFREFITYRLRVFQAALEHQAERGDLRWRTGGTGSPYP